MTTPDPAEVDQALHAAAAAALELMLPRLLADDVAGPASSVRVTLSVQVTVERGVAGAWRTSTPEPVVRLDVQQLVAGGILSAGAMSVFADLTRVRASTLDLMAASVAKKLKTPEGDTPI